MAKDKTPPQERGHHTKDTDPSWEKNLSSGSNLKRFAKISSSASGTALRWMGQQYLGLSTDQSLHASQLKNLLGDLKGPLMKAAQLLSTIPGALPDEYTQELSELQSQAPPMGWPFVKRRMAGELGVDWMSRFTSFDRNASAAASLGQVHQAVHLDGSPLAIKLQYPDMQRIVSSDLKQLKLFLSLYETLNRALKTEDIFAELKERLMEELDYDREKAHLTLYQHIFEDDPHVCIPHVYPELSTPRLLTMSWLEGDHLKTLKNDPQEKRNHFAQKMFMTWYRPLYKFGVIHGDPHLGNYSFTSSGKINLLDFGCVRFFDPTFIDAIINLYRALQSQKKDEIVHAYEKWGFSNLSHDLIDALTQWAQFLYDPLLEDRERTINAHHKGRTGHDMAMAVHQKLNKSEGVRPPQEFLLMDRAAVGMGAVFMHLDARINWYQLFNSLIDDFKAEEVRQRQENLRVKINILP
ncbi:AarF/ABC1/UbiB kinase family protein [Alphaproteobacteria bacterium]|nr:AarF/ABC1/UbiB kinase family protein [Alphaproteobacteria bacterium]